jgi:acyl-CoA synthetase (AMP-forming)/AMP-acid ligase II
LNNLAPTSGDADASASAGRAIVVPEGLTLTSHFDSNRAEHGDSPAYRFLDFSHDSDGHAVVLSWNELWTRVCAIGARLRQVTQPGDRVAILAPQGLDYVAGFFGGVYAGNIPVPLFAPTLSGHAERLAAVLSDARPAAVLTTTSAAESVRTCIRTLVPNERPRMIAVDALPDALGSTFTGADIDTDDVAYLQYTSGSTRSPAGVEITHRSVYTNAMQMVMTGGLDVDVRTVSWLPLYHDMGLMMVMFTAFFGAHVTLMDPMAFLRRPYRWIKQLGIEASYGRTFAAAPNFAFDLTAERGLPPAGEALDLSNVVCVLNGSEPVTMSAINKFTNAFAPYGLPANAVKPSYGMAEATLSVASIAIDAAASSIFLDREQLGTGRAVTVAPDAPGAVELVSCGQAIPDQWVVIVDPDGAEVSDGTVGEVWLHGVNIARGYFGREEESRRVFGNKLQSRLDKVSHAEGAPDNGCWLATGDLGVYVDGELYLTGRIKDLIILDGSNHYPTDIETTVSEASPAIRTGYVAAFSVPADAVDSPGSTGEQVVVIAERAAGAGRTDPEQVAEIVRAAVSRGHHIRIADLKLVAAGAIPRTTSGKLARSACRAEYLAGEFNR